MNWRDLLFGSREVEAAQREASRKRHAAIEAAFAALDQEAERAIERAKRDAKEAIDVRVGAASQHMSTPPTPEEPIQ